MKPTQMLLATAAFATALAAAESARADVLGSASVGVLVGEGFKDAYKFGLGIRAGYTFPFNLYLGGTLMYHFGTSNDAPLNAGSVVTQKIGIWYPGAEVGYEIDSIPVVVIRPYVGAGLGLVRQSVDAPGNSTSSNDRNFAFWPGVTAFVPIGGFFIGADLRYVILQDANAFNAFLTLGWKF